MDIDNKPNRRILIIEDDREISDLIKLHLTDLNYDTVQCTDGLSGLDKAMSDNFDMIILDLNLPQLDGLEICKQLRAENRYTPILMLTSRAEETDRVLGLELGADDYLTKPFSIRELIARVKAIVRRVEFGNTDNRRDGKSFRQFGRLTIDTQKRKVSVAGNLVDLTVKEFDLLNLFSSSPGRTYSREMLLSMVWGYQFDGYDHTVNSHINRLRAKIENDPSNPQYIKTVWGYGYRFAEPEELDK
jgi:two-component system, OmpR family, alkaline phosphatase synthesis response regulator PhoP